MSENAARAAAGRTAELGLRVVSAIHARERLRATISSARVAKRRRMFCEKFLRRVIGRLGVEKLLEAVLIHLC
jgi:hypothetical protein